MDNPVPPTLTVTPSAPEVTPHQQTAMSNDTKTIITILLLLFIYPIGLIMAWFWTKWHLWVKIAVTLPVVLLISLFALTIVAINPSKGLREAECTKTCQVASDPQGCMRSCLLSPTPGVR
jgi:hypothetical protein